MRTLLFLLLFASASPVIAAGYADAFYIPATDDTVLETLPAVTGAEEIRRLQTLLKEDPQDPSRIVALARAYVSIGKREYDSRYYGYAEALLAPYVSTSKNPDILLAEADILQHRHEYARALSALGKVLALRPGDGQALLTRAVIYQVQGNFKAASSDCRASIGHTSLLLSTICITEIDSLTGRLKESRDALTLLYARNEAGADPEERSWALTVLAEMHQRLDDSAKAEEYFRKALQVNPRDYYVLAALSDLLLAQKRDVEARELLKPFSAINPLLLRLALAEKSLQDNAVQRHLADLASRFEINRERGEKVHLRDEARYRLVLLGDAKTAFALAEANWENSKEPADADIYLSAAFASGEKQKAQKIFAWQQENRLQDVALDAWREKLR